MARTEERNRNKQKHKNAKKETSIEMGNLIYHPTTKTLLLSDLFVFGYAAVMFETLCARGISYA